MLNVLGICFFTSLLQTCFFKDPKEFIHDKIFVFDATRWQNYTLKNLILSCTF